MPLVDGAVRAGTAGECTLRLGGVFDIFHRLGLLRVRAQEGRIGGGRGVELVCRQRDEGHGEREFLQEASAGAIDCVHVRRPFPNSHAIAQGYAAAGGNWRRPALRRDGCPSA